MKKFKIYAGLNLGLGDTPYLYTKEFEYKYQAIDAAYKEACDIYESALKIDAKVEKRLRYYVEEEE